MSKLATAFPSSRHRGPFLWMGASVFAGAIAWLTLTKFKLAYQITGCDVDCAASQAFSVLFAVSLSGLIFLLGNWSLVPRHRVSAFKAAQALFSDTTDAVVIIDDGRIIKGVSEGFESIFGYRPSDLIGRNAETLFPGIDESGLLDAHAGRRRAASHGTREIECRTRSGAELSFQCVSSAVSVRGDRLTIIGLRDQSDDRQNRERLAALEEEAELYSRALDMTESAVAFLAFSEADNKFSFGYVNPAFERTTGYTAEMIAEIDPLYLLRTVDQSQREDIAQTLLRADTAKEMSFRSRGGKATAVKVRQQAGADGNRNFIVAFDAPAQKKAEADNLQIERLQALGQLTSNVAHDFNNFLGIIKGNLEMLQIKVQQRDTERELLERALRGCGLATDLVQVLAAFSRRQILNPTLTNVVNVVEQLKGLVPGLLDHKIELACRYANSTALVTVDRTHLQSSILNLVINSRDAMPNGGLVTIDVGLESHIPGNAMRASGDDAGRYVRISVIDNGMGMPESVRKRALEPYFTTKAVGKGTGLGLSTIFGFVQQSGGAILIDSEEGQGTTVSLYFPQVDVKAMRRPA